MYWLYGNGLVYICVAGHVINGYGKFSLSGGFFKYRHIVYSPLHCIRNNIYLYVYFWCIYQRHHSLSMFRELLCHEGEHHATAQKSQQVEEGTSWVWPLLLLGSERRKNPPDTSYNHLMTLVVEIVRTHIRASESAPLFQNLRQSASNPHTRRASQEIAAEHKNKNAIKKNAIKRCNKKMQ